MQDCSGAFGIWGPCDGDLWLTSYVTDFLTRAKEAGYAVRQQAPSTRRSTGCRTSSANGEDFEKGGEDRAYALYVLARNGRAPIGELRYYADTRLDRFTTPLAQAQLGAALAMIGDKERAETRLQGGARRVRGTTKGVPLARDDYGSALRDGAALVTLASETRHRSSRRRRARQRDRQGLPAAHLHLDAGAGVDAAGRARARRSGQGDEAHRQRRSAGRRLDRRARCGRDSKKGADGRRTTATTPIDAVVTVIGASLTPEPAVSKGFKIERSYYTLDGKPVDLEERDRRQGQLAQNERLVVVLKIESDEAGGRVLLVDRLPAGLEIENPRLVDSGDIKRLDWLKTHACRPEHTEFRDDRFVAAFNSRAVRRAATTASRFGRDRPRRASRRPAPLRRPPWPTSCAP